MRYFEQEYVGLIGSWVRGNIILLFINGVHIFGEINIIKFIDDRLIFYQKNNETGETQGKCEIIIDKLENIDIYVSLDNKEHCLEDLNCLRIYKENDEWKHEVTLPTSFKLL